MNLVDIPRKKALMRPFLVNKVNEFISVTDKNPRLLNHNATFARNEIKKTIPPF